MAGALNDILERNVKALLEAKQREDEAQPFQKRIADRLGTFAGSLPFVYLHLMFFGGWLFFNSGIVRFIKPWDPYPFVMLAMIASVEAIFLSTCVLINQNRMAASSERRADLDLQISLLTEHELTRLIHLVEEISKRVGAHGNRPSDLDEISKDIPPEEVLRTIEKVQNEHENSR